MLLYQELMSLQVSRDFGFWVLGFGYWILLFRIFDVGRMDDGKSLERVWIRSWARSKGW